MPRSLTRRLSIAYLVSMLILTGVLWWLSWATMAYCVHDSVENRNFVLWHGAIHVIENIGTGERHGQRFSLTSYHTSRLHSDWKVGLLTMFIAIVGAPIGVALAIPMIRRRWRLASLASKRFVVTTIAVGLFIWILSHFVFVRVGVLHLANGAIGVCISRPLEGFAVERIRSFHLAWLPRPLLGSIVIPIWLIILLTLIVRFRRSLRKTEDAATRCHECGFDLTGNISGICPECGRPIPDGQLNEQ